METLEFKKMGLLDMTTGEQNSVEGGLLRSYPSKFQKPSLPFLPVKGHGGFFRKPVSTIILH